MFKLPCWVNRCECTCRFQNENKNNVGASKWFKNVNFFSFFCLFVIFDERNVKYYAENIFLIFFMYFQKRETINTVYFDCSSSVYTAHDHDLFRTLSEWISVDIKIIGQVCLVFQVEKKNVGQSQDKKSQWTHVHRQ
jgi:hypothetical protein